MSDPRRYLRLRGRLGDIGPPFLAELPPGVHRLGSIDDNDIVVPFHGVSRHHLLLRVGGGEDGGEGRVRVEDLGSKNGTRINGRAGDRGTLEVGDELFIGPVRLRLESSAADDLRLAATADPDRPLLDADDLETGEGSGAGDDGPGEVRRIERALERLADDPPIESPLDAATFALAAVAEAAGAAGACWLTWRDRRRCLVEASWGVDFSGLLPLEALCQRAEALAGSRRLVVLRGPGPPGLHAAVRLGHRNPRALLLWDADASLAGVRLLTRLLERHLLDRDAADGASDDGPPPPADAGWVDGPGPASRRLRTQVAAALADPAPILIEGEAGTGKTHLARWIHLADGRPGPLVVTPCAELGDGALAEGYRAAGEARGTLVLEQIGDLAPSLDEAVLQILTAEKGPRLVLTRRLAGGGPSSAPTASRDLPPALEDALRRRVLRLEPLRRRRDDIPRLVRHRLAAGSTEERRPGEARGEVRGVTVEALRRLCRRDWPGHVAELFKTLDEMRRRAAGPVLDAASLEALPDSAAPSPPPSDGSETSFAQGPPSHPTPPAGRTPE